ncbi:MAG: hypothetical protein WD016_02310 [Balneolaceae bacterium]
MANDEFQSLEQHIHTIRTWTHERSVSAIQDTFLQLSLYFDQDQNKSKWKELREALVENEALKDEDTRNFLTNTHYSQKGNWWWDPKNWD